MTDNDNPQDTILTIVNNALRPLSTTEIADKANCSKPTALKYLKQLADNDEIQQKQEGNTYYWYTGQKDLF